MNKWFKLATITSVVALSACNSIREFGQAPENVQSSTFERLPVEFVHEWNEEGSHPFTGAAVIDIDNDGLMEVFVGGGKDQPDALLSYQNNTLIDRIEDTALSDMQATYGATGRYLAKYQW